MIRGALPVAAPEGPRSDRAPYVLSASLQIGEGPALAVLMLASLLFGFVGFTWGLPNGDSIWSTDALTPMAPLAAAYRLFRSGWNSGWFYYKYPLGHPLLLAAVYAPYLTFLWLSGGLSHPSPDYPYGFSDPQSALYVLGLLGRGTSALMTSAAVLFWYLACREVFGWRPAWLAGWFLATMFPVVFYAHATNVDAPLLCWCSLALYGAARVYTRREDARGMLIFGAAAAMALSTKEYALGLVVTLALVILAKHLLLRRVEPATSLLPRGTWLGLAVSIAVFLVMNGMLWNPLGMWHRVLYLADRMPEDLRLRYAPRFSHVGSVAPKDLATEVGQLLDALRECAHSIGPPVAVAALLGLLAFGWRSQGLLFALASLGYYTASLRSLDMMHARYVLPLSMLATAFAAASLSRLAGTCRRRFGAVPAVALVAVFVGYSGACAADALRLLLADTRYDTEAWLAANAAEASIEVYQHTAYLPRFLPTQRVTEVGFDDVSTRAFLERRPDLVVLSSAGLAGVTTRFKNDAEDGGGQESPADRTVSRRGSSGDVISFEYGKNRAFLDALERGCLGYGVAARFERPPVLATNSIPSLAPALRVFRRADGVAGAASSEGCGELLAVDEAPKPAAEAGEFH